MTQQTFWLDTHDHCRLFVYAWVPASPVRAVVMLSHGMAEHSGRYARLGAALNAAGIARRKTSECIGAFMTSTY